MVPKRGLTRFTENGAVFEDGSEIHDIDLVLFATGFDMDLDFIDVPGIKGMLPQILSKDFSKGIKCQIPKYLKRICTSTILQNLSKMCFNL